MASKDFEALQELLRNRPEISKGVENVRRQIQIEIGQFCEVKIHIQR